MLIRIKRNTWVDPHATRVALITEATSEAARRVWVHCPGTNGEIMEVDRECQLRVLSALDVRLEEMQESAAGGFV